MKKKLNISLDDKLVEKLDDFSERLHLSRSGVISVSLSEYFEKQLVMENFEDILKAYKSEIAK